MFLQYLAPLRRKEKADERNGPLAVGGRVQDRHGIDDGATAVCPASRIDICRRRVLWIESWVAEVKLPRECHVGEAALRRLIAVEDPCVQLPGLETYE